MASEDDFPYRVYFRTASVRTAEDFEKVGAQMVSYLVANKRGERFFVATIPSLQVLRAMEDMCIDRSEREMLSEPLVPDLAYETVSIDEVRKTLDKLKYWSSFTLTVFGIWLAFKCLHALLSGCPPLTPRSYDLVGMCSLLDGVNDGLSSVIVATGMAAITYYVKYLRSK